MDITIGSARFVTVMGDLTQQYVDAIVNAANVDLRHGGGVAGAIARAGGPTIQRESDEWVVRHGPLREGQAAVTGAGDLPCEVVVHVAGPIYQGNDRDEPALRAAARAACAAAHERGCRTVAFPAISAGIYGYPLEAATAALTDEIAAYMRAHPDACDEIRLVGRDHRTEQAFATALTAHPFR